MAQTQQKCCQPNTNSNNCVTQREHFNYLRNNSCGIWGAFAWGNNDTPIQHQNISLKEQYEKNYGGYQQQGNASYIRKQQDNDGGRKGNRRVSFDDTNINQNRNQQNYNKQDYASNNQGKGNKNQTQNKNKQRPASAFQRKSKIPKDQEAQRLKNLQNKQKVQKYIEELRPYSRGLSNTKFQDYFGKAAPQCYGRANTNEPIGGIIYGNHLKTFNVNPHVFTNHPEYYQTHTTAINYGKRAKVCEDMKWKRLQKQLSKKLGLKDKNQTIKQGKQVVYVDVDDKNKYQVMKQNHEFQKANRQQIHNKQVEYKKQKDQEYKDNVNQYYAKKQQKIADNLSTMQSLDYTGSNLSPQEFQAKLNQQVIYKYHDKNGNVRYAADRHGMTCFVDMNFPQNQAAYVEQLKSRMPIYPIKVEGQDKNLDAIRKANCKKGKQEIYPSHYLLRNCQQPEVLKMLSNKTGVKLTGSKNQSQGKVLSNTGNLKKVGVNSPTGNNFNKSFVSTTNTQQYQGQANQNKGGNQYYDDGYFNQREGNVDRSGSSQHLRANKSQIIDRAWGNRQFAGEVACNLNKTCCVTEHLPHNQMNPQCYKTASLGVGRIPFAG